MVYEYIHERPPPFSIPKSDIDLRGLGGGSVLGELALVVRYKRRRILKGDIVKRSAAGLAGRGRNMLGYVTCRP